MAIQTIYLDEDDDIVSVRDRLDWAREPQVVLVLPELGDLFTDFLDMALLRRHADRLRLMVGLVTLDGRVASHAKALGVPVFRTVQSSLKDQRMWWRGRQKRSRMGRRIVLDEADRQEVVRRKASGPVWRRWLVRYIAVLLFFLSLSFLFVGASYAVPGATLTLAPTIRPLRITKEIVANPELTTAEEGNDGVGARLMSVVKEWQAEVATTGTLDVPDAPARGTVVFVNQRDEPVSVPAGTRVGTSASQRIVFQTLSAVEIPGAVGGTAEADVVAIAPGPEGNVETNLINRIEGSLSTQLRVRNLEPTTGGGVRPERTVTEADQERLRSQVLQQLQVLALGEMEGMLTGQEFLANDSLRVTHIVHETFSHFPGEQTDRLTLEIRAELQATAVDSDRAKSLVYEDLTAAVRPGFELIPDSLDFKNGEVIGTDSQGRVTFTMVGEARVAAKLRFDDLLPQIAGQETALAMTYLYEELPLRQYPSARVWPDWFGRLPYLPIRIQPRVDTGG